MGNIGRRRRRIEVLPAEPATPTAPAPREEPVQAPERQPEPAR